MVYFVLYLCLLKTILLNGYINEHLNHSYEVPTKFIIFYEASLYYQIFFYDTISIRNEIMFRVQYLLTLINLTILQKGYFLAYFRQFSILLNTVNNILG